MFCVSITPLVYPCNISAIVFSLVFVLFIFTNCPTHTNFFVLPTRYGYRPRVLPACGRPGPCSLHRCLFCFGHRGGGSHRECLGHVCFFLVSNFPLNLLRIFITVTLVLAAKNVKGISTFLCLTESNPKTKTFFTLFKIFEKENFEKENFEKENFEKRLHWRKF